MGILPPKKLATRSYDKNQRVPNDDHGLLEEGISFCQVFVAKQTRIYFTETEISYKTFLHLTVRHKSHGKEQM